MSERTLTRLGRVAPLAGLAYAVLTLAGDLTIGRFPDSGTSVAELTSYYAAHHARVAAGGMVLAWAVIALAVFGGALWARTTRAGGGPVAAVLLVGTAAAVATGLVTASSYWILGHISQQATTSAGALQAWHVAGSEAILDGGIAILLLACGTAGVAWRAIPRWLAWAALPLGVVQLTPLGFLASMLFLLWAAVTGIALTVRPQLAGEPRRVTSLGGAAAAATES